MRTRSAASGSPWLSLILLLSLCGAAAALSPGEPAPAFELPWLLSEGSAGSGDLFAMADATVLVIWNRGCPRCTGIALGSPALGDSASRMGAHVVGILFGPDDPEELKELLWESDVPIPHLWDAEGGTAADYGLGFQHLGVFIVDRSGRLRAVFDDQIPNLIDPVLPALRNALTGPAPAVEARGGGARAFRPPPVQVEGRLKILSSENVRPDDRGLFGETLEPGTLLLHRWEVRASLDVATNVEFVPWLRVSNEPEELLTTGPEQLSHAVGSATLAARHGPVSASLGAFPLRLSPLLLQRWDAEDAPPLGGVSSCGCGAGASGLSQRSLEILGPLYTFEGFRVLYSHRIAKARGWAAVPRWEKRVERSDPISEWDEASYRRILGGFALDLGRSAERDPVLDLPSPIGLRLAALWQEDDRRTLPREPNVVLPVERDERGLSALMRIGPWGKVGLAGDAELVGWRVRSAGVETKANGWRAGLREEFVWGSAGLWGDVHRIRTEPGFDPFYMALSYDPNREGWRAAGGIRLNGGEIGSRERLGLAVFYRGLRETEERDFPGRGRLRARTMSVTLLGRPIPGLLAELHGVETMTDNPSQTLPDSKNRGLSFDLRWEGSPQVDPILRMDMIRVDDGVADPHTVWQGYLFVRVVTSLWRPA